MPLVRTMVQPLGILALERGQAGDEAQTALAVFGYLLAGTENPVQEAVRRYWEASAHCNEPHLVPTHDVIMRQVIRPLVEAKQCYVLGMPVACIAQAGLVGEMVALWRFRMLESGPGKVPDEKLTEVLKGKEFDKLRQERRVEVLRELEPLDTEMVTAFGELRGIRRQYLHFMVDAKKNVDRDARCAMKFANHLAMTTLGMTIKDGMMVFPP